MPYFVAAAYMAGFIFYLSTDFKDNRYCYFNNIYYWLSVLGCESRF